MMCAEGPKKKTYAGGTTVFDAAAVVEDWMSEDCRVEDCVADDCVVED